MPQSRFSLLDVVAAKQALKKCLGYRVNNIYDINDKTYAFKLHQTGSQGGGKKLLLMESGIRFHLTSFTRDKSDNPSPFTMKLRKHLRGKRLVDVRQLGMDRVVSFDFGSAEAAYHLILELYDKGNIVLCDYQYCIIGLLRSHTFNENTKVAKKQIYPLFNDTVVRIEQDKGREEKGEGGEKAEKAENEENEGHEGYTSNNTGETKITEENTSTITLTDRWNSKSFLKWVKDAVTNDYTKVKRKKNKQLSFKQLLTKRGSPYDVDCYGPDIVEHCLYMVDEEVQKDNHNKEQEEKEDFNPNMKLDGNDWNLSINVCNILLRVLKMEPKRVVSTVLKDTNVGYILYKTMNTKIKMAITTSTNIDGEDKKNEDNKMYCEFSPILLKQHTSSSSSYQIMNFNSFDTAVDDYFAKIETQKAQKRHQTAESQVHSKLEKMKLQQKERIELLEYEVSKYEKHAMAIEANIDNVQNSILVVNSLIANGTEWEQLNDIVDEEKKKGNPIALMISSLQFDTNSMYLLLPKMEYEIAESNDLIANNETNNETKNSIKSNRKKKEKIDGEKEKELKSPYHRVKIDLGITAFQNARSYYDLMKKTKSKTIKARDAANRATQEAEKKTAKQIEKQKISISMFFYSFFFFVF
jgi:predicted ribosome quality control (RQC) complex YloA/Tae2 family protein